MSEQCAFDPTSAELAHLLPPDAAAVRTNRSVLVRLKHELQIAPLLDQGRAEDREEGAHHPESQREGRHRWIIID